MSEQQISLEQPKPEVLNLFEILNQGYFDAAFLLLQEEQVNYTDILEAETKNTLLHLAILQNKNTEIILIVKEYGQHVDLRNRSNQTPLMFASYMGNLPIIKLLINKGSDINAIDNFNFSPLLYAVKCNLDFVAIYLVSRGADLQAKDLNGCNVVHWAAYKNNANMLKYFIKHCKMQITNRDWENCTPFMRSCLNSSFEAVSFFLDHLKDQKTLSQQLIPDNFPVDRIQSTFIKSKIRRFLRLRTNSLYYQLTQSSSFLIGIFLLMVVIYEFALSSIIEYNLLIVPDQLKDVTIELYYGFLQIMTFILVMMILLFYSLCETRTQAITKETNYEQNYEASNSTFSLDIDAQKAPLMLEEIIPDENIEKDPYYWLEKQLARNGTKKATFLHDIVNMIHENRFIEVSRVRPGHLDYNTLETVLPRTHFCEQRNKSYPLFCFYSSFFDQPICLGPRHKFYMTIQSLSLVVITVYLSIINMSFSQYCNGNRIFMMIETPYQMVINDHLIDSLLYVMILYSFFCILMQWMTHIYGIVNNLTYLEIMNNTQCYYFFDEVKPVGHVRQKANYHYRIYKNVNYKGIFNNIKFYLNA